MLVSLFTDKTDRGWKLLVGILGILAGILVLAYPLRHPHPDDLCHHHRRGGADHRAVYLVQGFSGSGWGTGVLGILSIIFGLVLIADPLGGAVALVLLLAGLAVFGGVSVVILAYRMPG